MYIYITYIQNVTSFKNVISKARNQVIKNIYGILHKCLHIECDFKI